jgi:hypothetical protein
MKTECEIATWMADRAARCREKAERLAAEIVAAVACGGQMPDRPGSLPRRLD